MATQDLKHISIIIDEYSQDSGSKFIEDIIAILKKFKIKYLTFFTANHDKTHLKNLYKYLKGIKDLNNKGVYINLLGENNKKENCDLMLNFAIDYSSRHDIINAANNIIKAYKSGKINIKDIDNNLLKEYLISSGLPDPDLIITTGGKSKIGDFFLWELSYSELAVWDKKWDNFTGKDLEDSIHDYFQRERRYGGL